MGRWEKQDVAMILGLWQMREAGLSFADVDVRTLGILMGIREAERMFMVERERQVRERALLDRLVQEADR